jgi:hypothetical protein
MGPKTMKVLRQRQVTFLKAVVPQFMDFQIADIDEALVKKLITGDGPFDLLQAVWAQIYYMKTQPKTRKMALNRPIKPII